MSPCEGESLQSVTAQVETTTFTICYDCGNPSELPGLFIIALLISVTIRTFRRTRPSLTLNLTT